MELKHRSFRERCRLLSRINRTFMELKLGGHFLYIHNVRSINRTFMELKQENRDWSTFNVSEVLIEPLWN